MVTDELTGFLTARLGEDEAAAKAWLPLGNPDDSNRNHIARHDPARVLREVEAKRKILAEYTRVVELRKSYPEGYDPNDYHGLYESGLEEAVTHLAVVYSDHPDYREDWSS